PRPPVRWRTVSPELGGLGVEVDADLEVWRHLQAVTRGCSARAISRPPRLEGRRCRVARRPQLVAAVAAKVQKPRRAQPAARAVDGEGWVGYVDVSGLLGCRHVQFRILVDAGTRAGRRQNHSHRYTGRREGWLTLAEIGRASCRGRVGE